MALMAGEAHLVCADPMWAVDPGAVGANLPPAGQSLFDSLTATSKGEARIPYPFARLVDAIEKRAGCDPRRPCTRSVLIPLGRSLQRTAANPDFFKFPRVVVALTDESDLSSSLFMKDRLYLGYQEKANLIEVISYNDIAGRFEFQIVKDYGPGVTPRVFYANRVLCMACHQNQAPLFSRQVWDETNANARIARELRTYGERFHGIPVARGVDIPNAIDESVGRANAMATARLLWAEGCGVSADCRRALLLAALQYRLTGGRGFDEATAEFGQHVRDTLAHRLAERWPDGLAIPNPEIPNRNPLQGFGQATGVALSHVPAALEPLLPRPPLAIWHGPDPGLSRHAVAGVSEKFSKADIMGLRQMLRNEPSAGLRPYTVSCVTEQARRFTRVRCDGAAIAFAAVIGKQSVRLDWIGTPGNARLQHHAARASGGRAIVLRPLHDEEIRLSDGNALDRIELDAGLTTATVWVRVDFTTFARRVQSVPDALIRPALLAALGRTVFPPSTVLAQEEPPMADLDATPAHALFHRHCASCHRSHDHTPPNFLSGDARQVASALRRCAPRIYVRLSMGLLKNAQREKTPMPPVRATRAGSPGESAMDPASLQALLAVVTQWLRAGGDPLPSVDVMLREGYESLPACLPEAMS